MSHCIKEHDLGAVGFTSALGKTWHGVKSYKHYDGELNIENVERVIDFEVQKIPLYMYSLAGLKLVEKAYCLYRPDKDIVLYPNVGESYEVISNIEMLDYLEGLTRTFGKLAIESAGTLNNGQTIFINLLVDNYRVTKDNSPLITRLMLTNSHGGGALTACLHQTRVVCMNTIRLATAQGLANDTLKRFRHTKNISEKVNGHILDLRAIIGKVHKHNQTLDILAETPVTGKYVSHFLEHLFPKEKKDGRSQTIAANKQNAVLELYETKSDLRFLGNTRYRLLNAVTDYTSHLMSITDSDDPGKRLMNVAMEGGSGDVVNQKALQLLLAS